MAVFTCFPVELRRTGKILGDADPGFVAPGEVKTPGDFPAITGLLEQLGSQRIVAGDAGPGQVKPAETEAAECRLGVAALLQQRGGAGKILGYALAGDR